jgi:hypothetical protein
MEGDLDEIGPILIFVVVHRANKVYRILPFGSSYNIEIDNRKDR